MFALVECLPRPRAAADFVCFILDASQEVVDCLGPFSTWEAASDAGTRALAAYGPDPDPRPADVFSPWVDPQGRI